MKKQTLSMVVWLVALPVFGQWQLIDDFQQWEYGQVFLEVTDIGWHASSQSGTDEYWMLRDPHDSDNIGLYVESGDHGVSSANTFVVKELPGEGIPPGRTGTLYLRSLWKGIGNGWHVGTADKPLEFEPESGLQTAPAAWGDFNALIRLGSAGEVEHRDAGGFVSTNPPVVPEVNEWYSFWIVVENEWSDFTSPPSSIGIYTLYIRGPGIGDVPTLVQVGTIPQKESASLRRAPADEDGNPRSIIWVMFATRSPNNPTSLGDPYILDDFHFFSGINLSDPADEGSDCVYCPDKKGDADTGNLLGWINVNQAPHIWSYSLEDWVYMEEPAADASGAWGYFYK